MLEFLPERIRSKITFAPCPIPELKGDCWIWAGAKIKAGYGYIGWDRKSRRVHIVVFQLSGKTIPEGFHLDHLCRVTSCCNPDHLEAVTCKINLLRGEGFAAVNAKKTHCINGHPLTEVVLRKNSDTSVSRVCRACCRMYQKKYAKQDPDKFKKRWRAYREANREKRNAYASLYGKRKRAEKQMANLARS